MTALFVDTAFFIALEDAGDQQHSAALEFWRGFREKPGPIVTTSYVFDEVVTFFNSRGHHAKAVEIGQRLLGSASVLLVHVDELVFHEAWRMFERCRDKQYSLTDCVSFVVMKSLRLRTALTFDKHFAQAGFVTRPGSKR